MLSRKLHWKWRIDMYRMIWRYSNARVAMSDLVDENPRASQDLNLPDFARISPVFPGERLDLLDKVARASAEFRENPVNDLPRYYQAFASDGERALTLWRA